MRRVVKTCISFFLVFLILLFSVSCGGGSNTMTNGDVYIYNFGNYLAEEAIDTFEKETGIRVHQDLFEANEEVIPVIESGAKYDVICISDYCIEKMIAKNFLLEVDKNKIPNYENLNKEKLKDLSVCDPGNKYAVPYFCGHIGILYNRTILNKLGVPEPTSWADLFDERLNQEIIMQSSIRDLYTVALKKNGYSCNSKNKDEIDKCTEDFIKQKPYVQCYLCDLTNDKILSGEAAIAPITSGDVQYVYLEGGKDDYCFVIPKEGTQEFIDAWCILKNSENVDNAYKFIDYMCREDIAKMNAEFIGYESVNDKVNDNEFLKMKMLPNAFKDYSNGNNELERDVGDAIRYYSDGYNRIKAS